MGQEFGYNVLDLLKQKVLYPYECMRDFKNLKEELSSKEKFYSLLTGKKASDKEYVYFPKVWKKFEIKTMKDYHDLHLKCLVLLLSHVFEKIRNSSIKNYGLCISHDLSTQALSWDATLNMTKVDLELIPDPDMHIFFENGMRGVVSYISNRYIKANNKYLKSYDPEQESKHIIYFDANNLF